MNCAGFLAWVWPGLPQWLHNADGETGKFGRAAKVCMNTKAICAITFINGTVIYKFVYLNTEWMKMNYKSWNKKTFSNITMISNTVPHMKKLWAGQVCLLILMYYKSWKILCAETNLQIYARLIRGQEE